VREEPNPPSAEHVEAILSALGAKWRLLFVTIEQGALRLGEAVGCAGPHYHPHDLRHRRITIWHQSGVPARELAERAGHARPSMSLDVYSHVMPPDELASERVLALVAS